jgi:hypothetical protein
MLSRWVLSCLLFVGAASAPAQVGDFYFLDRGTRDVWAGLWPTPLHALPWRVQRNVSTSVSDMVMTPDGRRLVVCGSELVFLDIDPSTGSATERLRLPIPGVRMRLHRDGTRLFVATGGVSNSERVTVVHVWTGAVLATIPIDISARDMDMSPDGSRLYVSHHTNTPLPQLTVIDTTAYRSIARLVTGEDEFGEAVAAHPDGVHVYLSRQLSDDVLVLDMSNLANVVQELIPMDDIVPDPLPPNGLHKPSSFAFSSDGARLWTANWDGSISIIGVADQRELETFTVTTVSYPGLNERIGRIVADRRLGLMLVPVPAEDVIKVYRESDHRLLLTVHGDAGSAPWAIVAPGTGVLPAAALGTVNAGRGVPEAVLKINGAASSLASPVRAAPADPITITLDASSSGPTDANYVLYAWRGPRGGSLPVTLHGSLIGSLVAPGPFMVASASDRPFVCLKSPDMPPGWAGSMPTHSSPPTAPFSVTKAAGFSGGVWVTLQGVIGDYGASNPQNFSVTNAAYLIVR